MFLFAKHGRNIPLLPRVRMKHLVGIGMLVARTLNRPEIASITPSGFEPLVLTCPVGKARNVAKRSRYWSIN